MDSLHPMLIIVMSRTSTTERSKHEWIVQIITRNVAMATGMPPPYHIILPIGTVHIASVRP